MVSPAFAGATVSQRAQVRLPSLASSSLHDHLDDSFVRRSLQVFVQLRLFR